MPWGRDRLALELPPDWPIFDAEPAPISPPDEPVGELVADALNDPIDSPPLKRIAKKLSEKTGTRIAIVVDDLTRHTPQRDVLPTVLEHLGAGRLFREDQIEIHFALGMHRPMTREEMAERVGPDIVERFACYNNPWKDPGQYRRLGRTRRNTPVEISARVADADLRILVGSVNAHLQAGFAGGMKLLAPGMASLATIRRLHLKGTETFRQLIGLPAEQNPMRLEIDRLLEYLDGTTFSVQLMLDGQHRPLMVRAGHPVAAQRSLAGEAIRRFGVALPGKADLLVANSYPLEHDLWQGFKCLANTVFAARDGGVIVVLMKADAGSNEMDLPKWWLSRRVMNGMLRIFGRDGLISILGRLSKQANDEAKFFVRFALGTLRRNAVLIYSPNLAAEGVRFPGIEIYDNLADVWSRAARLLGASTAAGQGDGPRVTVFGQGGVCYPL